MNNALSKLPTPLYTTLALLAFAGNSILCRLALAEQQIDAASFSAIRLLSGALMLLFIMQLFQFREQHRGQPVLNKLPIQLTTRRCLSGLCLFIYVAAFSYAYLGLETGVGALILFASVQVTIVVADRLMGNRASALVWFGLLLAFSGFIYLLSPGLQAPPLTQAGMMLLAGMAWGGYTLLAKRASHALQETALSFLLALPLALPLLLVFLPQLQLSTHGLMLAILSGAVTSGVGYTLWYLALDGLSALQAAVVQLLVPVLAGIGGMLFAGEPLSLRFGLAAMMILGGVLLVISARSQRRVVEASN